MVAQREEDRQVVSDGAPLATIPSLEADQEQPEPPPAEKNGAEAAPGTPNVEALTAQLEEQKAENARLEQALRSRDGNRMKDREREELLHELAAGQKTMEKGFGILASVVTEDDRDKLPAQLGKTLQEGQTAQSASRAQRVHDALLEDMRADIADVKGADGKPVVDIDNSPEFDDWRTQWNAAAHDPRGIDMARLHELRNEATRKAYKAGRAYDQRRAAEDAKGIRKKVLDETGALDLDTGPGSSGGGSMTPGEAAVAYNKGEIDAVKYKKIRGY
jgi:hypothetical protein